MRVYSEPGQGTTFKVYLPRVDEEADARAEASPPAREARAGETLFSSPFTSDALGRRLRQLLDADPEGGG